MRSLRAVNEAYRVAWLAGDSAAVLRLFAPDAVLLPHHGDPPVVGLPAIRAFWWPPDGSPTTITTMDITTDGAEVNGDQGVLWGRFALAFRFESDGRQRSMRNAGTYLMVLRRTGGHRVANHASDVGRPGRPAGLAPPALRAWGNSSSCLRPGPCAPPARRRSARLPAPSPRAHPSVRWNRRARCFRRGRDQLSGEQPDQVARLAHLGEDRPSERPPPRATARAQATITLQGCPPVRARAESEPAAAPNRGTIGQLAGQQLPRVARRTLVARAALSASVAS